MIVILLLACHIHLFSVDYNRFPHNQSTYYWVKAAEKDQPYLDVNAEAVVTIKTACGNNCAKMWAVSRGTFDDGTVVFNRSLVNITQASSYLPYFNE